MPHSLPPVSEADKYSDPSGYDRGCHIAVVASLDPESTRVWSGTPYFMTQALRRNVEKVSIIGGVEMRGLRAVNRLINIQRRYTGWHPLPGQFEIALRHNGRKLAREQVQIGADVLFVPAGSSIVPGITLDTPVVYTSDATVRLLHKYYDTYNDLPKKTVDRAEDLERRSIARADLLIYPTEWVAQSAIEHYGADPAKVHVVPYGANLSTEPDRERALAPRDNKALRLLFVGVDWVRKGGNIAIEALQSLRSRGIDATMTVVGCVPPPEVPLEGVTVIPFLNKNNPEEARQMAELYYAADLFVLPTRAECYGIVFAEAAAHGVPCLTTDTGGVSGAMSPGKSGFLFRLEDRGEAYAQKIAQLVAEPGALEAMRQSARHEYETRFNWDDWARSNLRILSDYLAQAADPS